MQLDVLPSPASSRSPTVRWSNRLAHASRIGLLVLLVILARQRIRFNEAQRVPRQALAELSLDQVLEGLEGAPTGWSLGAMELDRRELRDRDGNLVGTVTQTAPESNRIVGYVGPSNLMVWVAPDSSVRRVKVLESRDTEEHVDQVMQDSQFWEQWVGLDWEAPDQWPELDTVSGATLTSIAMIQSLRIRAGGQWKPLKFPEPVPLELVENRFGPGIRLGETNVSHLTCVRSADGLRTVGWLLRTSPVADRLAGYQGPTDALALLDPVGELLEIEVLKSFDNQPYVGYLDDDRYLEELLQGASLEGIETFETNQYEGVSGATMTSMNVLAGLQLAAAQAQGQLKLKTEGSEQAWTPWVALPWTNGLTVLIALAGTSLLFSNWTGRGTGRKAYLILVVIGLGWTTGDLLSQSQLTGWTQYGIPWRVAPGLVLLTAVALLVPMFSRSNVYCSHLCPLGAVQQLVKPVARKRWRWRIPANVRRWLKRLPAALLLVSGGVLVGWSQLNLAHLEAFDAFSFPVASSIAVGLAVIALVAAVFHPMAYCQYGCPTGGLLEYLRYSGRRARLVPLDGLLVLLLILVWF